VAVPGFPGAIKRVESFGLWAIFQAIACSRPPEPRRRMFIGFVNGIYVAKVAFLFQRAKNLKGHNLLFEIKHKFEANESKGKRSESKTNKQTPIKDER
jgi:hypothetical protein